MTVEAVTAVLVLFPDAEPLLDRVRQVAPELVRALPAHVSLLYPGPAPTAAALADVESLAGELPGEVELTELVTGADGFVGVAAPALDPLLARFRERHPDVLPYEGRFGTAPSAHLTLALGASDVQTRLVGQALTALLPCRSRPQGPVFVQRTARGWVPVSG